jgi:hypothetical protein
MKPPPLVTIFSALLVSLGTAHCANDETAGTMERPKVWPKATEPPPASAVYHDVREDVPDEAELERAASEHAARVEGEIDRSLDLSDPNRREAVIVFLLPELLQLEPGRVRNLVARAGSGAKGDLLRLEVARLWISQDPGAAVDWLKSLEGDGRRAAVIAAVTELAPFEPVRALQLAREFSLEKDDSLRKLLSHAAN